MAGQILATFPALPAFLQTVTLDGIQYRAGLTWRDRTASWYLDLWLLDGTPLLLGRRLSPGVALNAGLQFPPDAGPTGFLFVTQGTDPYRREDLGETVQLVYYTLADVQAAAPAPTLDDPTAVVV